MFIKGIKYYIALLVVSSFVIMIIMLNFTSSLDFVDIIFNLFPFAVLAPGLIRKLVYTDNRLLI